MKRALRAAGWAAARQQQAGAKMAVVARVKEGLAEASYLTTEARAHFYG